MSQEDPLEHPAKKFRSVDGSYRRSNLGVRVTSALQDVHTPFAGFGRRSPSPSPPSPDHSTAVSESDSATDMCSPRGVEVHPAGIPMTKRHPQMEQTASTSEIAGSLDGWLKHNMNLPSLKKLRRDSTCSMQSLDAWMDTGYASPVPSSPQWFRLQPSPGRQSMRSSPSLDIQVLSPVVPEAYPDDMDMMMSDGEDFTPMSPPSPSRKMCSPRFDKFIGSPMHTPRRRAPSRLGWRSSPKREGMVSPRRTASGELSTDGSNSDHEGPSSSNGADAVGPASSEAHEAGEMRALEARFLQQLQAGNGMVLVTEALRLFRGYMEADEDKDAVRSMLKRWCVLVEHPIGSGCRWLYLRSAAEAAGATLPDCA